MTADLDHPDFANVVHVPRFHQAPQRDQAWGTQADNVIILPVIRIARETFGLSPRRPVRLRVKASHLQVTQPRENEHG
jgi:hypothetical protein